MSQIAKEINEKGEFDSIHRICFLHNYRTHFIGLNQIATVSNKKYDDCYLSTLVIIQ